MSEIGNVVRPFVPDRPFGGVELNPSRWKESLEDPVRGELMAHGRRCDLDTILNLFPRTSGDPAHDPAIIDWGIQGLKTKPEVNTGHPFLDLSVKIGLVFIDATFQGNHPKYGVKGYGQSKHDAFPPTIIAAVDALSGWGLTERAAQLFRYWLLNLVRSDGTIDYYGPSLSEYGQLLHSAALLEERGGADGWWRGCLKPLRRIADHLLGLVAEAERNCDLVSGSPEADERHKVRRYFHNNLWVAKGLIRWTELRERHSAQGSRTREMMMGKAKALTDRTVRTIEETWPADPSDWWLPPQVEQMERPKSLTATRDGSYTNYRYWPEMLSSGLLPRYLANRIVEARLAGGGQFCGMTRFSDWLDDWPLADYLHGVWRLGRIEDFLLSLYGHVSYHQAQGHLTAYEQVTLPPGKEKAPYCLPCQLVAARAARLLVRSRT